MATAEVTEATPMAEVAAIGNLIVTIGNLMVTMGNLTVIIERGWHSWNYYCFLQRKTSSPLRKVAQTLMSSPMADLQYNDDDKML